ncbi:hypothetical protein C8J56DRAFT_898013 [Mycena floridula]|nr:hypothetical protein C8J56DRAFT_898013 [Mycena floridula]
MLHRIAVVPALLALFTAPTVAQISLYIPGFDAQPISADVLGVDGQGRTTWALHAGAPTNSDDQVDFVGTATLVEGPNDATLTLVEENITIGYVCALSAGVAKCSGPGENGAIVTETESISFMAVQAGTTVAQSKPTGTGASDSVKASSQTASSGSPTSTSNAGFKGKASGSSLVVGGFMVALMCCL